MLGVAQCSITIKRFTRCASGRGERADLAYRVLVAENKERPGPCSWVLKPSLLTWLAMLSANAFGYEV